MKNGNKNIIPHVFLAAKRYKERKGCVKCANIPWKRKHSRTCSLFDMFKQCWNSSTFRCVMEIVPLRTISYFSISFGKTTTKYYNSEANNFFEHIWYALFLSTKRTQCIGGCSQIIYAKTSVRVSTPVHCSECLCVHYWIMKLRILFYKIKCTWGTCFERGKERFYLLCKYKVSTSNNKMSRNADTTPKIIPVKQNKYETVT